MLGFNEQIWRDQLTRIISENYLLENYGTLDILVEMDQHKPFAFKVSDINRCQQDIEEMKKSVERCLIAINLTIDTHYLSRINHSDPMLDFNLHYNLEVREVEVIGLQDSFDYVIRGVVYYGIEENRQNQD